jgi:hypothetical protein
MEEPKRNERVLIVGILLFVLIVGFLLIVLYSTKNKNQVKIYSISGESENFYYNNALFISSNVKNIFVYGELEYKTRDINITNVSLMSGERLIISSDSLPKGISIENYGYDELFPEEVVKNLDNWYLEITYSNSKETKTEKLELNNNYLMKKQEVQPIAMN